MGTKRNPFAKRNPIRAFYLTGFLAFALVALLSCGKAKPLFTGTYLGPAKTGSGSRTDGTNFGQLYEVVQIAVGTDGLFAGWAANEYPFYTGSNAPILFNSTTQNSQLPFQFNYSYPPNNYKLIEAHIVMDTSRDGSCCEGIMVDGVLTGYMTSGILNSFNSPKVEHRYYLCPGSCSSAPLTPQTPANSYFNDWTATHYKMLVIATFDLNIADLLPDGTKTLVEVVNDGNVKVVVGDDTTVYNGAGYEPKLFLKGVTISKNPLTCTTTPTYQFRNTYVHNDGNTINQSAFAGAVSPKFSTDTPPSGFRSVHFYFDPHFPTVASTGDINLTSASLTLQLKRNATDKAAIVINGVGVSETGFDRSLATDAVESWNDSSATNTYWTTFLSGIPTNSVSTSVSLDLIQLLGASTVRDLIAQGKFNVEVAGSLHTVWAQGNTSSRSNLVTVNGPEFVVNGSYSTKICDVPDDPDSPLSDDNPPPSGPGDTTSPVISSVQAINITSSSATIQWLTDEGADSEVGYGVGMITTSTPLNSTLSLYHNVTLTGLQPYKYYYYEVRSKDGNGNPSVYATKVFRTLR